MSEKIYLRRLGTMLDCSRNAVMTVDSIKKWIDITSDMGYNTLMIYTEDVYEVDENPYFGYMRGRYTKKELREVNDYAVVKGMELIPCIQTLAHLNAIVRWPAYRPYVDTDDILLAGDEAVYELIDRMFATLDQCFTSRIVNLGMDEAHMIGRGKYYDLHGDAVRSDILLEHIKRVAEIGEKYGFTFVMWSDMFYKLAAGGNYRKPATEIEESVKEKIPENVELIYWDYYSTNADHYDGMLASHENIKKGCWFAGGLWTWTGLAPHNGYSIKEVEAAFQGCNKNGIKDVLMTIWANDGGECSKFAVLPSLFYTAELAKGNTDAASIKAKFQKKYGISFDNFMLVDLLGTAGDSADWVCNAEKYLLYNDCFTGLMDCTVSGGENAQYKACARKLGRLKKNEEWGYLFENLQALCEVLAIKAELGTKTRQVYHSKDKEALQALLADYKQLYKKVKSFYRIYKKQWFLENKPHGFDVQDIRLGGLLQRIESCMERLQDLYDGKIEVIAELEEKQLDFFKNSEEFITGHHDYHCIWGRIVTANSITDGFM